MAHLGRRPRASGSVIDLSQLPSPSPSGSYHLNHSDSTLSIRMQKRRWSNFDTTPCLLACRGEKTRTSDLHVPNVARCQLCYTPNGSLLSAVALRAHKGNYFFWNYMQVWGIFSFVNLNVMQNVIQNVMQNVMSNLARAIWLVVTWVKRVGCRKGVVPNSDATPFIE